MNWFTLEWKDKFAAALSCRSILKLSPCFLGIFIGNFNWTVGDQMINLQPKQLCLRTKLPPPVEFSSAQVLISIYMGCVMMIVCSRWGVWASQAGAKPPNPNFCHCWKESGRPKQSDSCKNCFQGISWPTVESSWQRYPTSPLSFTLHVEDAM